MWRFGCGFLFFILLVGSLVALVAWLVGGLLGSGAFQLVLGAIAVLLLVSIVVRLARRTGAPVADLIEGAGRIEAGEIGTQVPERGPSEVRSLARAFNAMSARLAANEEARRTLLADVSHELRTPLTVMQGTLEGVLDGVYPADEAHLRPVLEETRVLSRLIDDLRTLSLSEAGALRLYREPTDLPALLAEVVASHRAVADEAGVRLELEVADLATRSRSTRRGSVRSWPTSLPMPCVSRCQTVASLWPHRRPPARSRSASATRAAAWSPTRSSMRSIGSIGHPARPAAGWAYPSRAT